MCGVAKYARVARDPAPRGRDWFHARLVMEPERSPREVDFCASTKTAPPATELENVARPARVVMVEACCRNTRPSGCASPPALTPAPASLSETKARPARRTALRETFT